jgi:hypothetical protein
VEVRHNFGALVYYAIMRGGRGEYRSVPQMLFQLHNYISLGFSTRCMSRDCGVVEERHNFGALVYYAIVRGGRGDMMSLNGRSRVVSGRGSPVGIGFS